MNNFSFFWHDYETFGRVPRRDRPAQFAGVRTDAELDEIEAPLQLYCQPAPDVLPDPEACLLTGILPQTCLERGITEAPFAAQIEAELARPGTVGVGYNSIRFDDEVTRHLFWRNLIDPYAREWQNDCGRWDLLDVVRAARALRPGGMNWPTNEDGRASFKLTDLTAANGLAHEAAHDALSDVRATLALARAIRKAQPKLWDFCLRLRRKEAVLHEMGVGRPFIHISGRYASERGCTAIVWPLAPHPQHKNEVIVWDLAADPAELFDLNAQQVRERLFVRNDELPEGAARLPIKTIHLNRSPIVVGQLKTLTPALAGQWGINVEQCLRHAEVAARGASKLAGLWMEVFERPERGGEVDVDEDLYGGFISAEDRRSLQRLRGLAPDTLAQRQPAFQDERLPELLFRYRARNHAASLTGEEREAWQAHCAARLHHGAGGATTLTQFFEQLRALQPGADERGRLILAQLAEYAGSITPPAPAAPPPPPAR